MSHEFESGFVTREAAWHGLATVLPDNPGIAEALSKSGLDWAVQEMPVFTLDPNRQPTRCSGWKALVRATDGNMLGMVTEQYKPYQNKDAFGWFQKLVDDGTCKIETAGSLQGGKKVWIQARYADDIEVKDDDVVIPYLLLANGHDGKMSLRIINTPVRVVCWNTMQAAGASEDSDGSIEAATGYAIAHQGDMVAKANSARNAIVQMNKDLHMSIDAYRRMTKLPVSEEYVRELAKEVFDVDYLKAKALINTFRAREEHDDVSIRDETRRAIAELEKMLTKEGQVEKAIVHAFHEAPGAAIAGETAWGAFNAVTHYLDHGVKGSADRRLASSWFGEGARKRRKTFDLIAASL